MESFQCLDVTLRDGGNRINFHFTEKDLRSVLTPLDQSGIEFVEVGYRNGAIRPVADIGPAGLCNRNYLTFCKSLLRNTNMVVMAHPQNLSKADIIELKDCDVSLLRLCVSRGKIALIEPVVAMCRDIGLKLSINFIHASQYSEAEMDFAVARALDMKPEMIYFADSNGSLMPSKVDFIYSKYKQHCNLPFGFHAHDNLGLAQANAISAMHAGASFLDFSLAGMGKGIGNLKTEFFCAYLQAAHIKQYNLSSLLLAANYIRKQFPTEPGGVDMDEFRRGILDLSTAEVKNIGGTVP